MKKLSDFFFSLQFALTLLVIFAVTIGTATFIEKDYGTTAAKVIVYDATWFEVLLFLLAVSLTGNIFRNKLIQRKKYNVLIFHLAFVVILLGAAISRYTGYEGTMRIREGETSNKIITDHAYLQIQVNDGIDFSISYGAKIYDLPFYISLRDFQLDRYPGSQSPSSFASEVTLIDPRYDIDEPRRIYMNNVLNYSGYRFFQSSYDQDEKGTILSVNHDQYGTMVTYFGYFLMSLGMLLNFFGKKSRFRFLIKSSARIREELKRTFIVIVLITLTFSATRGSKNEGDSIRAFIDKDHARSFGELLVQDNDGRIEPMNTLTSEVLRKVARKNKINGLSADQIILGMVSDPGYWQTARMIKVSDQSLIDLLGLKGKYASFNDFLDLNYGTYKISDYVDASYKKKPAQRTGFEKDIIKVDERVNICYMIYTGSLFRIFPMPGDENNKWYATEDAEIFDTADVVFIRHILPLYYSTINKAIASGNWEEAGENLDYIKRYQKKYGEQIFPNQKKIRLEILYNNINLFKKLFLLYSLAGFILLMILLITTIRRSSGFRVTISILIFLLGAAFASHTAGLAARWYISGHAPWSNGYETMIYIAWATMASGFIFMKHSRITLAVTSVLASLTLMVANMSWMDPEITTLVPVLKSYWLIIHVAVITASYSFLAIGMILGFLILIILSFASEKSYRKIKLTIQELTNINEMNLTIGVVLLTIGTFLGAVWANESWGRYWGWDPKETWTLVSILVYSFVIHMRMVPGLRGNFAFNFAALISFSSIIMTYFGVNYYLSGLHSYASGDPVPIPLFVYYAIVIVAFVSIFAFLKERKLSKLTS